MPVRIRRAAQYTAMFSVDAGAAQRMIDYLEEALVELEQAAGIKKGK